MLIKLLPSEIARLVLNYLEEEKYPTTYEAFLNESRYLEECKIYIKQGASLPKTIHGKKLTDFLVLERDEKSKKVNKITQYTQTDKIEDDYASSSNDNDLVIDNNDSNLIQNEIKEDKGISFLTELIESNDLNVEIATDSSSINVSKIKIIKSPEIKLVKYSSIMKSPEKKIRLDIKPDIIELSSDDESDREIRLNKNNGNKKRKLLIGKNVEKIPELSVSTLERQLNTIISDATNHMKQQEDQEKLQQQQLQQNSFNIINTINKGPPLLDFQMNFQNIQPQVPTIIQQAAAVSGANIQHIPIQHIQQFQQASIQQQTMSQFQQNSMPQKVFIIANPNTLNFTPNKQDQFIRIPQLSVNSINCINNVLNNNNNNERISFEKPSDILENALKIVDPDSTPSKKLKENNVLIKPKPASIISSQSNESTKRKSISDKEKLEPVEKKKKVYPRHTTTIKSIFEKTINNTTSTSTAAATATAAVTTNQQIPVITLSPNSNSNCSNDTFSIHSSDTQNNNITTTTTNNNSSSDASNEIRNADEQATDAIFDMLGLNLPVKENKNQSNDVTDFDLDDLVKKSTNLNSESIFNTEKSKSPVIVQKKAQKINSKRKSNRQSIQLDKPPNDDLNLNPGEITSLSSSNNNNEDDIRQLRSRTNSQRKML